MIIQQAGNSIEVDVFNERIIGFILEISEDTLARLSQLQTEHKPSKVIIFTPTEQVSSFIKEGFQLEGRMDGFFYGKDAFILTKYLGPSRAVSQYVQQNNDVMKVVDSDTKVIEKKAMNSAFTIHQATASDAPGLAALYKKVFKVYPTNVHDPQYLIEEMGSNYLFVVMKDGEQVISAASAFIRPEYKCAEITDCATDPDYRGQSLLPPIVIKLEELLAEKGVGMAYSLTRAQSYGMNLTVKRLGYTYQGCLVNNCIISSGFEDMNIWTKLLK
ncbi:putative beta-lysine N-acetyltransferase [Bacillus tianshenii]|nr:putative beta-lysine N-acetyltransferase [Bacillus tianshenii]